MLEMLDCSEKNVLDALIFLKRIKAEKAKIQLQQEIKKEVEKIKEDNVNVYLS